MLRNFDSQKRFVLFWPHKRNKNIFINSGAIYQAKCYQSPVKLSQDRMCYVLARWRPTIHQSFVCRSQIVYTSAHWRCICMLIIIITVYQWIFGLATGQPIKFLAIIQNTYQSRNKIQVNTDTPHYYAVCQCWLGSWVVVTYDFTRSFFH